MKRAKRRYSEQDRSNSRRIMWAFFDAAREPMWVMFNGRRLRKVSRGVYRSRGMSPSALSIPWTNVSMTITSKARAG